MMGRQAKQTQLWSEPVNLFRRIPEDHLLRGINRVLNLDFVREEVAATYGRNGHVSVDPVVIMKMMLLLFLDDVPSERELMKTIALRIDYLWFLGYGLDDGIPNHSVLSKARRRWGVEVFEGLFTRTVAQCLAAGLIKGEKLQIDASLIDANASKNSVRIESQGVMAALRAEFARQNAKLEGDPEDDAEAPPDRPHEPPHPGSPMVSSTDPDATVVRQGKGGARARYKHHRATDEAHGVITAVETTTGIVDEGRRLAAIQQKSEANTGHKPRAIVADRKYGTTENFVHLSRQGIRSHMGDLQSRQNNHRLRGIFPSSRFRYDRQRDVYVCPADQELYRRKFYDSRGHYEYIARAGVCTGCSLRAQCTRAQNGRTLKRHPQQHLLERARRQSHSAAARRDRARRQHQQERSFADAANNHGFKRARWRGLWRQSIQDYLIAALQNLRILLKNTPPCSGGSSNMLHRACGSLFAWLRRTLTSHPALA